MPDLTFNEFQRELIKRNIEPNTAYMLTLLYERMGELIKQQDDTAKMLLLFAKNMQGLVVLNEQTQNNLKRLAVGRKVDGVDVYSVAIDPMEKS
jgi:intergrase/recombinase